VDGVKINVHVLCALMLHKIGAEVDHADVVVVDKGGAFKGLCSSYRS
jgi:hypothetical protein